MLSFQRAAVEVLVLVSFDVSDYFIHISLQVHSSEINEVFPMLMSLIYEKKKVLKKNFKNSPK